MGVAGAGVGVISYGRGVGWWVFGGKWGDFGWRRWDCDNCIGD